MRTTYAILLAALCLSAEPAAAQTVTLPNTFTAGSQAKAAEVNDNFTAVKTAVDSHDARLTATETAVTAKQNRVTGACLPGTSISAVNANGTVTCGAQVTSYLQINPFGVAAYGDASFCHGTGVNCNGAIVFPDSASSGVNLGFTIPDDYVAGTTIYLDVFWKTNGVVGTATDGSVSFRYNWSTILRPGSNVDDIGGGSAPSPVATVSAGLVHQTAFSLGTNFQEGDAVVYGFYRNVSDTSTDAITIGGLRIRYTAYR